MLISRQASILLFKVPACTDWNTSLILAVIHGGLRTTAAPRSVALSWVFRDSKNDSYSCGDGQWVKFGAALQEQGWNVPKGLSRCVSLASILPPMVSSGEAAVVVSLH